jgi:hypothetical protein
MSLRLTASAVSGSAKRFRPIRRRRRRSRRSRSESARVPCGRESTSRCTTEATTYGGNARRAVETSKPQPAASHKRRSAESVRRARRSSTLTRSNGRRSSAWRRIESSGVGVRAGVREREARGLGCRPLPLRISRRLDLGMPPRSPRIAIGAALERANPVPVRRRVPSISLDTSVPASVQGGRSAGRASNG